MQIKVTARHLDLTDALRDYSESKLSRITKFLDEVIDAHIVLSVERYRHIAEITIKTNQAVIHGQGESDDMYNAIDFAVERVERQLIRFKGKYRVPTKGKPEQERFLGMATVASLDEIPDQEGSATGNANEPQVIRSRRYATKPMSLEEAVMQMKTLTNMFLVFTNAHSEEVNVLYRRKDGNFGLIEPEMK